MLALLTPRSQWAGSLGPPSSLSLPGSMSLACHSVLLEAAVTVGPPSLGEVTAESNLPYLVCVHVCSRPRALDLSVQAESLRFQPMTWVIAAHMVHKLLL